MQHPQLCGMVVLKVLTGIGLISDSFEGYSSYKCGCPSKQKTPPLPFSVGHAEKTWSYFIGCKIRARSISVFELLQYASLTLVELPYLKHVENLFASLLRQSCAAKYVV